MKRSIVILLFALGVFILQPVTTQAAYMGNFMNGERYMQLEETTRTYLVIGMYDMLSFEWDQSKYNTSADYNTKNDMARVKRCLTQKSPNQIRVMLDQYLTSKPDAKIYNIASSFSAALNTMCPQ
jgi:hypothetical protein